MIRLRWNRHSVFVGYKESWTRVYVLGLWTPFVRML